MRRELSPLAGLKSLLTAVGFEVVSTGIQYEYLSTLGDIFNWFMHFLNPIYISSVNVGNEITVEHLAHDVPSLLFGMFIKLESNSRDNPIRCAIGARYII